MDTESFKREFLPYHRKLYCVAYRLLENAADAEDLVQEAYLKLCWTSLMLVMLAFFGLILLSIGIMGIYLMNILNEAKKMPHYVIRREDTDE